MNILETIDTYIAKNSNFNPHRDYLGLSKIADCPRRVVDEYLHGSRINELTHRMSYAGYEQESMVLQMLERAGVARQVARELVAPFDARLKGHIDAETVEGDLLEIKSVSTDKFRKIHASGRPLLSHIIQVQLYMHFGSYQLAEIVYRCRETYEHLAYHIRYNPVRAEQYVEKAKRILAAIDKGDLPDCECGRCQ